VRCWMKSNDTEKGLDNMEEIYYNLFGINILYSKKKYSEAL